MPALFSFRVAVIPSCDLSIYIYSPHHIIIGLATVGPPITYIASYVDDENDNHNETHPNILSSTTGYYR
jgi:hypothetical protein